MRVAGLVIVMGGEQLRCIVDPDIIRRELHTRQDLRGLRALSYMQITSGKVLSKRTEK